MAVSRQTWRKNPRARGLREGYRSGLEETNAKYLEANAVPFVFEKVKIKYIIPATERTYSLDFELLKNGIMVETKGKFEPVDRAKHLYIKLQHPDLDIRFVFQRPNEAISKGSKTTYAMWADKHGFKWATKVIPLKWCNEPGRPGVVTGERVIQAPELAKQQFLGIGVVKVTERQGMFKNMQPRTSRVPKASGLPTGVFKRRSKFVAEAKVDGVAKYIGIFDTPEEAGDAYAKFIGDSGRSSVRANLPKAEFD